MWWMLRNQSSQVEIEAAMVVCEEEHSKSDEPKNEMVQMQMQMQPVCDDGVLVVFEEEHKSDEPKTEVVQMQMQPVCDDGVWVVCEEERKNDEPKTEVIQMQMQPVCDDGGVKEEGAVSVLGSKVKPRRRFTRSTLKKNLDGGESKVVSDGVEKEVEGGSVKMSKSKGSAGKKFPSKLKDLLSSGILEGLPVNYVRGMKAKTAGLPGVISGNGVVCYCKVCNGVVVSE
ncbi:hypothetical protein E2542_SST10036 [Spatholobus suberectus]|nr:hypothetical protein E2542_SST10036 [Spatholobus suberectus]